MATLSILDCRTGRNQAQSFREDLDTGLVELEKECTKCGKSFTHQRDLKYHEKGLC